ncbi:uroporphyrinogen-III C-methyltransferase [Solimicrobium silvestre]|uniref:uroporphyrinogen-III C-methyltransferase n=1 Tax=Solimicrobium silvestre TaxID=2099400 RepID=A0A2S9GYN4_9BURK|nr:uroporphyrinogen-III C-methyltransferase [Solimicrobium silvestre]PRC92829.1 Uroporphyrinogen-III C-methyltransferase [Solimicrobium silvestre]
MGKVVLIGAGPGAADLITVRGARLLALAEVVLHDALVSQDMLDLCPQAIKVPVGKRFGKRSTAQAAINQQLVEYGLKHALVVRLKGGDPMLFGRADEELAALEQANIEVEVVPGISTAFAAAAATLQPLTKRGCARSVAFFTSSSAPELPETTQLPDCDTLVQYMGGQKALQTAEILLAQGRSPNLPVVIIENCSLPNQRIQRLKLADLQQGLEHCHGPVLVMIGEAFAARNSLS